MYSLTFCVRFLLPERHQRKSAVQAASNVENAQLVGSLYHAPKLHPGPYSSVGVRPWTDTQTDARDHNTFCVIYDSHKM